jgi:transposase-like protein
MRSRGRWGTLDMKIAAPESETAGRDLVQSLATRLSGDPASAIIDGNAGLRAQWSRSRGPARRTNHKLQMVYAGTRETVEHAGASFLRKWRPHCKAVVSSLEAGDELFTVFAVPELQWKALRITNALERINGEFPGAPKLRLRSRVSTGLYCRNTDRCAAPDRTAPHRRATSNVEAQNQLRAA